MIGLFLIISFISTAHFELRVGDQRIFYAGSCAHIIQAGTTIIILVTVSFLTIPLVGISAVPGRVGPKSQWFEWLVIRVTWKSSILNDLVTWELFVTWLALCNLVTWLDLLGLQWLVCDLRVLKSHMRTRYSRNGSCILQNCSNLVKLSIQTFCNQKFHWPESFH